MLSDQIHDAPAAISLLDVLERKSGDLGAPQPAAEEDGEDRPVPQALVGPVGQFGL
jgi:hypothetical protein